MVSTTETLRATLRRIEDEDGKVVEEQEQFVELVSSEFLLQNLKNLLDGGFKFENPNATKSCGCGTSFTPKM